MSTMHTMHVEESGLIQAAPEAIYAVLADYRNGHPHILPKEYFGPLVVEQGGVGAGTVVRGATRVMGAEKPFRLTVEEPEPGRVLVERDAEAGLVTTFTLDPAVAHFEGVAEGVTITWLRIRTEWTPKPGLAGSLEARATAFFMRRVYRAELKQIEMYMQQAAQATMGVPT